MKTRATESGSRSGAKTVQRCEHGLYVPPGDTKSWGCAQCYPDGHGTGPTPILPRSSADTLNADRTAKMDTCNNCGGLRTFSSTACRACGTPFPTDNSLGRAQGSANVHAAGVCPKCGSTVHYETKKASQWECSDCGKLFPAPKRKAVA